MALLTIRHTPASQPQLATVLQDAAQSLNQLRYQATPGNGSLTIVPLANTIDFFRISPSADRTASQSFLQFFDTYPPRSLANLMARHDHTIGRPSAASLISIQHELQNPTITFPRKLEILRSIFASVHPDALQPVLRDIVLPWFFSQYPDGRIIAVSLTEQGHVYERLVRNLAAMWFYGFDAYNADLTRRKPFTSLLPTIMDRLQNILKFCVQYNGPYIDAFCLAGIFSTFILVPNESVHRRSIDTTSLQDCISPFSSATASSELHEDGGFQDTIRSIHPPRAAADTDAWVRYWVDRSNVAFDRLYNFSLATDAANNVDFDVMWRGILQFDRIFFEIAWSTSVLDQFIRKTFTYAVVDKITAFMGPAWAPAPAAAGTQKFIAALTPAFLTNRLPQLFHNAILNANGMAWIQQVYNHALDVARQNSYPAQLIQAGSIDFTSFAHLNRCQGMPGSGPQVNEATYLAQVIRAIRNTHHGYSDLFAAPFAMLSTTSGVVSEDITLLLPFFGFAMLDDPSVALSEQW
jgi:hypothetical protein